MSTRSLDRAPHHILSVRLILGLSFRFREDNQQKDNTKNTEHPERRFLSIPYLRLPHQEPLAAYADKCHKPQQHAQSKRNDRKTLC
jgi:hypothetical protein